MFILPTGLPCHPLAETLGRSLISPEPRPLGCVSVRTTSYQQLYTTPLLQECHLTPPNPQPFVLGFQLSGSSLFTNCSTELNGGQKQDIKMNAGIATHLPTPEGQSDATVFFSNIQPTPA